MSSSSLQCLFCNHLNPGGASFCNDCGSQLHLQQCDLCGSINKRTARLCYKCGATFTLPAAHGLHSAILENAVGGTALSHVGSAVAPPNLPESAAHNGSELHQKSQFDGSAALVYSGGGDARENLGKNSLNANSSAESLPAEQMCFSESVSAVTVSRCRYPVVVSALVLAGIVLLVCSFVENSRQGTQEPGVEHAAPVLSDDGVFSGHTPSALGLAGEAEVGPTGRMKKYALRVFGFGPQPSPPPADQGVSPLTRVPPAAENEVTQASSVPTGCQQEVVTLGLCSSIPQQERP